MKRIVGISAIIALLLSGCNNDPIANFAFTPSNPFAGQEVFFENYSIDAETFEWDFGDGTISTVYNPSHAFAAGGTYNIELKAFGKRKGLDVIIKTINVVSIDPSAEFSIYTDLPGDDGPIAVETDVVFVGEQVEFYNTSEDGASYLWDFGDGYESDLESPIYSYDEAGTYTIELTAYGFGNEVDTYTKTIEVFEGINSTVRITVLDYDIDIPFKNVSVLLFGTIEDWENYENSSYEVFTSELGKCVFEGMNYQRYYVDALFGDFNNYALAAQDVYWIETQVLEPNLIHDFIAYISYNPLPDDKKGLTSRLEMRHYAKEKVALKKSTEHFKLKENKFSKTR